jgi:hypothetical protein
MTDELLSGLVINLLRRHFAVWQNLEDPNIRLEDFAWRAGDDTGVVIEALEDWTPEKASQRASILIQLNDVNDERILIGDRAGTDDQSNERFQTLCVGSHTVVCLGGHAREAKMIATEVRRQLRWFGVEIAKVAHLVRWRVMQKGRVAQVEESTDNWMVPVTVGWAYTESWTLFPVARPLRRAENKLRTS